jgi:hypothetical protein
MADPESNSDRVRRRGARIGIAVFATFVASFTLIWSWQILTQVFNPSLTGPARSDCRSGVLELLTSVEQARRQAGRDDEERAALARFRRALEPAWSERPRLDSTCAEDPEARRALPEIDEFRYAEEHAVRRDLDLSRERQRARELYRRLSRTKRDGASAP